MNLSTIINPKAAGGATYYNNGYNGGRKFLNGNKEYPISVVKSDLKYCKLNAAGRKNEVFDFYMTQTSVSEDELEKIWNLI